MKKTTVAFFLVAAFAAAAQANPWSSAGSWDTQPTNTALPSDVAYTDVVNTFTSPQVFSSTVQAFAVGIGTGIPQGAKLQINDSGANQVGIRITNSNTGPTSSDGLFMGLATGGQAIVFSLDATSLQLGTSNDNSILIIDSSKNVGVGGSPTGKFDASAGTVRLFSRTSAQLGALAPTAAGQILWNSDRTMVCSSTGTGVGAWLQPDGATPCD